jgi:hypothetical protein
MTRRRVFSSEDLPFPDSPSVSVKAEPPRLVLPHQRWLTTAALYECAKVNIFRDHDLEKMFGHN